MSSVRYPLPASLGAVFSAEQARTAGLSRRRLRAPDVVRIASGVYARAPLFETNPGSHPQEQWRDRQRKRALALAPFLPAGHFFSLRTAAVLWRLPVPADADEAVRVSCFPDRTPTKKAGYRASRISQHLVSVRRIGEARVTCPASTWAMLAPELAFHDGVALGDAVIRRPRIGGTDRLSRPPHATVDELQAVIAAGRRRSNDRLRAIVPHLSTCSASAPESHLRLLLFSWGIPRPELDYDVCDADGRWLGTSEFVFPAFKLVIEYEGIQHRDDPAQWERDIEKYRRYAQAGWEVLRVTAAMLYRDTAKLGSLVLDALVRRGWSGRL